MKLEESQRDKTTEMLANRFVRQCDKAVKTLGRYHDMITGGGVQKCSDERAELIRKAGRMMLSISNAIKDRDLEPIRYKKD